MKIDSSIFGDMAIKDLSPKDNNSSGRIIKNLRICGSGIYRYHRSEAVAMGITIPGDYQDEWFGVYRSPEMLVANKDLYARIPIITGHHIRVTTDNAKELACGMVGDTVQAEVGEDGETYLYTTGTIITGDGIEAYEKYGELSVGYDPVLKWEPGEYKGQKYQVVMKGLDEVNHLLICKTARGGHQCCVMDSLDTVGENQQLFKHIFNGGIAMGIFKKIFGKPAAKAMNGDARVISAMLQSVKAGADCKTQVEAIKTMLGDSADETLKGYFEDLTGDEVAKADKETLGKAIDVVDTYCQKLFGDEVEEPKEAEKKKDEEAGDADVCPHCGKSPCECKSGDAEAKAKAKEPKKEASNGDSIDYEKLATMVAEKLKPAEKKAAGDEAKTEVAGDEMEVSKLSALLAGDENSENAVTSDSVMKEIWG